MDKSTAENGYTLSMKKLLLLFVPLLLLVGCQNSDPKDGVIVGALRECHAISREYGTERDVYGSVCTAYDNNHEVWIVSKDVFKLTILTPQGETYVTEMDRLSLVIAFKLIRVGQLENGFHEAALIGKTWPPPIEDQNEKDEEKDEE